MTARKPNLPDADFYRDALRSALSSAWLDRIGLTGEGPKEALQAAWRLACDLGWCRLLAVQLAGQDGSLTVPWALAAARAGKATLTGWTGDAASLSRRWADCDNPLEGEELCLGLFENRMDAWACYVAIDEAYLDCLQDRDERASLFSALVNELLEQMNGFDRALQGESELLSLTAGSGLLDSWRQHLAGEFREPLPWWLDGRLERLAMQAQERALATLPGPEAWKQQRQRLESARIWGHPAGKLPPCRQPLLAAASAPSKEPLPGNVLVWRSPDRACIARLILPEWSTPELEERDRPVTFLLAEDQSPAVQLAGALVLLAGVEGRIAEGSLAAWFRLAQLRGADELTLHVGENLELWQPGEESA